MDLKNYLYIIGTRPFGVYVLYTWYHDTLTLTLKSRNKAINWHQILWICKTNNNDLKDNRYNQKTQLIGNSNN